ncbi:hypothetical protein [Rhizobacter sp. Root404]|jgi:hypothetical protein|uniref:hypothetical protein n=1 Tax=Rhizobacter sp. Root404 TaxID=1736528 RepID=UPI0006F33637|nr:hypothetical protein [Rhizobacter sp. Root404]KQW38832.1 hypothetical protein ASC76_12760 [Rhizobacter sp. Root404]
MHFDERKIGEYRVYTGALEGPQGDGYIAALVVMSEQGGVARELVRDESLACGHRWPSPDAALAYAMTKAQDIIRKQALLTC